jgi:hypothetical protein
MLDDLKGILFQFLMRGFIVILHLHIVNNGTNRRDNMLNPFEAAWDTIKTMVDNEPKTPLHVGEVMSL